MPPPPLTATVSTVENSGKEDQDLMPPELKHLRLMVQKVKQHFAVAVRHDLSAQISKEIAELSMNPKLLREMLCYSGMREKEFI